MCTPGLNSTSSNRLTYQPDEGAFTVVSITRKSRRKDKPFQWSPMHMFRRHVDEQTTTCALSRPIQSLHRSTVREELPVPQVGLKNSTVDRNASNKCCSSSWGRRLTFPIRETTNFTGNMRVVRFSSWGFVTQALCARLWVQPRPLTRTGQSLSSKCRSSYFSIGKKRYNRGVVARTQSPNELHKQS